MFVFDDYCVMITCGLTTLVDSIERLLQTISVDSIAFLVYERKKEHFPERQPTTFLDDARRLQAMVPGRALRFGDQRGHYVQMFHTTRAFVPETGAFETIPVYDGPALRAGDEIDGPALIERADTTIFVSAAFAARLDEHGSCILRRGGGSDG